MLKSQKIISYGIVSSLDGKLYNHTSIGYIPIMAEIIPSDSLSLDKNNLQEKVKITNSSNVVEEVKLAVSTDLVEEAKLPVSTDLVEEVVLTDSSNISKKKKNKKSKTAVDVKSIETSKVVVVEPTETPKVVDVKPTETTKVDEVKPTETPKVVVVKPTETTKVDEVKPTETTKVDEVKPTETLQVIEFPEPKVPNKMMKYSEVASITKFYDNFSELNDSSKSSLKDKPKISIKDKKNVIKDNKDKSTTFYSSSKPVLEKRETFLNMLWVIYQDFRDKIDENPTLLYNIWQKLPLSDTEKDTFFAFFHTNDVAVNYWKKFDLDTPVEEFKQKIINDSIDLSCIHPKQACFKKIDLGFVQKNENKSHKKINLNDLIKFK